MSMMLTVLMMMKTMLLMTIDVDDFDDDDYDSHRHHRQTGKLLKRCPNPKRSLGGCFDGRRNVTSVGTRRSRSSSSSGVTVAEGFSVSFSIILGWCR